jgi:hypothetical protein
MESELTIAAESLQSQPLIRKEACYVFPKAPALLRCAGAGTIVLSRTPGPVAFPMLMTQWKSYFLSCQS